MTDRFDQLPDAPYATCSDCDEVFPSRTEMSAHLSATSAAVGGRRSHSARITNPTRPERICRELEDLVGDLEVEFAEKAWRLVDREGVTEDEITEAVRQIQADFAEAWKESAE